MKNEVTVCKKEEGSEACGAKAERGRRAGALLP
jgi:hypothetical protein